MRHLVALVAIVLCLMYWFTGSITEFWMAPAFQPQYWGDIFGFGYGDLVVGVIIGIALYAIFRPSHSDYGHYNHHSSGGCNNHHNCGCH